MHPGNFHGFDDDGDTALGSFLTMSDQASNYEIKVVCVFSIIY